MRARGAFQQELETGIKANFHGAYCSTDVLNAALCWPAPSRNVTHVPKSYAGLWTPYRLLQTVSQILRLSN
jgi:hypothetical protein